MKFIVGEKGKGGDEEVGGGQKGLPFIWIKPEQLAGKGESRAKWILGMCGG